MKRKSVILNLKKCLSIFSILILIFSCGSKQDIVYFQDIDIAAVSKSIKDYIPVIRPSDELTITISALDQDVVRLFNLPTVSFTEIDGAIGRTRQQTYLVDTNGSIYFPVLGALKLAGLNRIQATSLIKGMLKEYIKDPIVNIRTINFKVTILGEVNKPGSYIISNERVTIIEALGLAGDMTIQGERKNVLVIREINGKTSKFRIDMTSEAIFNSPVYYLRQNDVIYIQQNNSKIKSSTVGPNINATLGVISTLAALATVIISITR